MGSPEDYELLPTDPELLHAISLGKDHDHLRAMVSSGADVDGTDGWENTPLWCTCNIGDEPFGTAACGPWGQCQSPEQGRLHTA